MVKTHEVLAIIPARGGSKSIPYKNIKLLNGIPLIAYSIAAGLQAQNVNRVIVSTDDKKIADIARHYGAEVPFIRPEQFARDETTDLPVFQHALSWLAKNEKYEPDVIVQLRPTSPIRPLDCIDSAINILLSNQNADSVRGVVPSGQNPYKMWQVSAQGTMTPLLKVAGISEPYNTPRQELPITYWQTGHVDVIRRETITDKHSMTGDRILPIFIDSQYSVDLDTENDWKRAELLLNTIKLPIILP